MFAYSRQRPVLRVVLPLLCLVTILFIFWNSSARGEVSQQRSESVVDGLSGVWQSVGVSGEAANFLVRKAGHLLEYMLLGGLLLGTLRCYTPRVLPHLAWPLLTGLLVALADETLQLSVPGRSGQVSDVWIDMVGLLAGLAAAAVVLRLVARRKARVQKQ